MLEGGSVLVNLSLVCLVVRIGLDHHRLFAVVLILSRQKPGSFCGEAFMALAQFPTEAVFGGTLRSEVGSTCGRPRRQSPQMKLIVVDGRVIEQLTDVDGLPAEQSIILNLLHIVLDLIPLQMYGRWLKVTHLYALIILFHNLTLKFLIAQNILRLLQYFLQAQGFVILVKIGRRISLILISEADASMVIKRFLLRVVARRLLSRWLGLCLIVVQAAPVTFQNVQTIIADHR